MSTSSIRWPKNVALARISRSTIAVDDCSGMAASFSSRCSRQGEWTSRSGTAKTARRGQVASHRASLCPGLRPITWSQWSMASRSGLRWAAVIGSSALTTRTSGRCAPSRPIRIAWARGWPSIETTRVSTVRPSDSRASTAGPRIVEARSSGRSVSSRTRTPAPGIGSRRKWRRKGSSNSSLVAMNAPGAGDRARQATEGRPASQPSTARR